MGLAPMMEELVSALLCCPLPFVKRQLTVFMGPVSGLCSAPLVCLSLLLRDTLARLLWLCRKS